MSEWKEYKLGELGTVITGKTPSSRNPEDWGEEMLFVTPSDYRNYRKYANDSERKLSTIGIERLKTKVLPPKSVLVTCIGSDMGKVVMSDACCITNQQINAIIPHTNIDNDFLYYKIVSIYDTLRIYGGDGTAVPIVNKNDFENIKVELPTNIDEQKRIASILSSLDDKIDLLNRENSTLEAMARTLFRQWFIEEAKENWEEKPLSSFGKIVCGKTPPKNESKYFGGSVPFIKIPDMHSSIFVFNSEDSLTEEGKMYQSEKTLPPGSIIVSCIATVGLVVLNAKESQTNQQINSIIPYKEEYRYFLFLHLKNMYNELNAMASGGTATLNLNTKNFSNIHITCPNRELLVEFNEQMQSLFRKIFCNEKQIIVLAKQRNELLPKLMSNEIAI